MRSGWLPLAVVAAGVAAGCAPVQRANPKVLYNRASYDIGCPQQSLQVYQLDGRTHAVSGCGRRLVYLERCDSALGRDACTWVVDTPNYQQLQWPQQTQAQQEQAQLAAARRRPTPLAAPVRRAAASEPDPLDVPTRSRRRKLPSTDEPFGTDPAPTRSKTKRDLPDFGF